jgi:hypothetical protein
VEDLSTMTIAHAIAHVIGQSAMTRSKVVDILRNGAGMTEGRANEVIAYGLAHSLLVEDPSDATRLQGTPKASPRP